MAAAEVLCSKVDSYLCLTHQWEQEELSGGAELAMKCDVLKEVAEARKTLVHICLRWVYEQGDCVLMKSFDENRLKENLETLDWELSEDDRHKISRIPLQKTYKGVKFIPALQISR